MKPYDLKNQTFGRLTALRHTRTPSGNYGWYCQCECGNHSIVRTADLLRGHIVSCGCYRLERTQTHGMSNTPLYDTWHNILRRCSDKEDPHYGGKGIELCDEWKEYPVFYEWCIKNGYKKGLTIDRIDNDKGYSPSNCRFITMRGQERNKTNNIYVTYSVKKSRLYRIWHGMITRCNDKNAQNYKRYGANGISVCKEWLGEHGYESFKEWALSHGYADNLTLDRKDNDGNYEPANCRWATYHEQNLNRTVPKRKFWEIDGVVKARTEWCKEYGKSIQCVTYRMEKMGMSVKEALMA